LCKSSFCVLDSVSVLVGGLQLSSVGAAHSDRLWSATLCRRADTRQWRWKCRQRRWRCKSLWEFAENMADKLMGRRYEHSSLVFTYLSVCQLKNLIEALAGFHNASHCKPFLVPGY